MDQNIDDRNDIDGQTNVSLVFTKGADRLNVDHAFVDFNTGFFADFICNHLGSDGAVEFARFSGFACKCDPCAVDSFGNNAHFAAQLFAKNFSLRTNAFSLFQCARGSQNGVSLRDQIVASVAIGNLFDITRVTKMINIFQQ